MPSRVELLLTLHGLLAGALYMGGHGMSPLFFSGTTGPIALKFSQTVYHHKLGSHKKLDCFNLLSSCYDVIMAGNNGKQWYF